MNNAAIVISYLVAALLMMTPALPIQAYNVDFSILGGGGGDEASGNNTVATTTGQSSAVGPSQSTNYRSYGGFRHAAVNFDTVPPVVGSVAPSGWVTTTGPTITAGYSDAGTGINSSSASISLDGGGALPGCTADQSAISCPAPGLGQGHHTVSVSVSDNSGNPASGSGSFDVDSIAPVTTDNAPVGWQSADFDVTFGCSDATSGCVQTRYTLDGGGEQAGGSVSITTDGDHTVEYYSTDTAGNAESPHTVHAKLDKTAPLVAAVSPSGMINDAYPPIAANYSDSASGINIASASLTLDGGAVPNCTATEANITCISSHLLSGVHTIGGSISDNVGHSSAISGGFTLEYLPVRLARINPVYYGTLGEAFSNASDGDMIEARGQDFDVTAELSREVSLTFSGGYDAGFTDNPGSTSFRSLTITAGGLVVENLAIW